MCLGGGGGGGGGGVDTGIRISLADRYQISPGLRD